MYTACYLRLLCLYMCLCRGQCPGSFPRRPGRDLLPIGQAGELGGLPGTFSLAARQDNPGTLGLQRLPPRYSECQPRLLCSGPLPGPQLRSLSPALVKTRQASSTEPLVLLQCIIHHSSAEGARGAPGCSGRCRPWAGHGGRRHAVRSDGRCPSIGHPLGAWTQGCNDEYTSHLSL